MEFQRFFSDDYFEAREKFIQASQKAYAKINSYHSPAKGPEREDLFTDASYLGPLNPKKLLITLSGVHGAEGFCGSAIQTAFLSKDYFTDDESGLLFIHAINPYGFAHLHRETEDNVDLNRNFIQFGKKLPENKIYDQLHSSLIPQEWYGEVKLKADAFLEEYEKMDKKSFLYGLMQGQYAHPKGLFFGGFERTWSNKTLFAILETFTVHPLEVFVIDFHTGYGTFGEVEMYVHPMIEKKSFEGLKNSYRDVIGAVSSPYPVNGSLCEAISRHFSSAKSTCGVVEFGTYTPSALELLRLDRWLHEYSDPKSEQGRLLIEQVKNSLYPPRDDWKKFALEKGVAIIKRTLEFLALEKRGKIDRGRGI